MCGIHTYLCSRVHMWQRVLIHVCILTHIWRADADIKCLPRLLHILSFETGSLIKLGAHQFGAAGIQVSSRESTCLHPSNLMLSYQTKMHSVYIGDVDLNLHNMPEQHIPLSAQPLNSILNTVIPLINIRCLRVSSCLLLVAWISSFCKLSHTTYFIFVPLMNGGLR